MKNLECPKCKSRLFKIEGRNLKLKNGFVTGELYAVCADCNYRIAIHSSAFW